MRASRFIAILIFVVLSVGCTNSDDTTASPPPAPEPTAVDVILLDTGDMKLQVIKVIREVTDLGLADAKDRADSPPVTILKDITPEEAEAVKASFEAVGATVVVQDGGVRD